MKKALKKVLRTAGIVIAAVLVLSLLINIIYPSTLPAIPALFPMR